MSEQFRICFVCLGNVCRSPTAEVIFRWRLSRGGFGDLVVVSSAGTSTWHVGDPMDPRSRDALVAAGYDREDAKRHRARHFTRLSFSEVDMVVAMDRSNEEELRALASDDRALEKIRLMRSFDATATSEDDLDVPDPYYGGPDGFQKVVKVIEQSGDGLLAEMARALGRDRAHRPLRDGRGPGAGPP